MNAGHGTTFCVRQELGLGCVLLGVPDTAISLAGPFFVGGGIKIASGSESKAQGLEIGVVASGDDWPTDPVYAS